jgi:hypothetical protein
MPMDIREASDFQAMFFAYDKASTRGLPRPVRSFIGGLVGPEVVLTSQLANTYGRAAGAASSVALLRWRLVSARPQCPIF